jgi:transcriptional regulator GlxA family with amidase domain
MKAHLSRPLRVATLAAMANRSESHYATLFCRQTGYPPIDYFIRLRIQRACQLLDSTTLSVKQVAAGAGYGDPLYFSRVFRTVMDMSPSQYRMQRKG